VLYNALRCQNELEDQRLPDKREVRTPVTVRLPDPIFDRVSAESRAAKVSISQIIWLRLVRMFETEDREARR
jgi:hypothetical protein